MTTIERGRHGSGHCRPGTWGRWSPFRTQVPEVHSRLRAITKGLLGETLWDQLMLMMIIMMKIWAQIKTQGHFPFLYISNVANFHQGNVCPGHKYGVGWLVCIALWGLIRLCQVIFTLAASIDSPHLNVDLCGVYMDDCFKIKPSTPAASCT